MLSLCFYRIGAWPRFFTPMFWSLAILPLLPDTVNRRTYALRTVLYHQGRDTVHASCLHSFQVGILLWLSTSGRMDAYPGPTEKGGREWAGKGGGRERKYSPRSSTALLGEGWPGRLGPCQSHCYLSCSANFQSLGSRDLVTLLNQSMVEDLLELHGVDLVGRRPVPYREAKGGLNQFLRCHPESHCTGNMVMTCFDGSGAPWLPGYNGTTADTYYRDCDDEVRARY